ncbi:MAG: hypothetical protein VXA34_00110 [Gammaproteobacteria bacterium]
MSVYDLRSISQGGTTEPFELQVSRGQISGHTPRNIFGTATAVGTSFVTPWELANTSALPFLSAQSQLTLSSSSASDTAVSILINGLDDNYEVVSEVVSLNGTTGVTTTKEFKFINDLITVVGNAVGFVSAKVGATTYAAITAGYGRNQAAVYHVPVGHSFYLMRIDAFSASANNDNKYFTFRNHNTFSDGRVFNVAQTSFLQRMDIMRVIPFKVPEKTCIEFQFALNSTTADIGVFGEGVLVKEQGSL